MQNYSNLCTKYLLYDYTILSNYLQNYKFNDLYNSEQIFAQNIFCAAKLSFRANNSINLIIKLHV